jgi:hypothetical protein
MKSIFHRYSSNTFEISPNNKPTVFTYEMLPWIEKNTLASRNDGGGVIPIPPYSDDLKLKTPASLAIVERFEEDGLTLLFNPRLKLGANSSLFFLDTSEEQRYKNKAAPVNELTSGMAAVLDHPTFRPGSVEELRQFLRNFEKYNEKNGWMLDVNPFFWRYFHGFSLVVAQLSDAESNVEKGFGLLDGRVYNFAYIVITLDWVIKHHQRLGDHAIPLVAHVLQYLNSDPVVSREVLKEVNAHNRRRQLSLEQRFKLFDEYRSVVYGTTRSDRKLAFHAQKLIKKSWKPFEQFFAIAFFSDLGVEANDDYLKAIALGAETDKGEPINIQRFRAERSKDIKTVEVECSRQFSRGDNFAAYVNSLPDPLTVYKGGVVVSSENIREGKGGKTSAPHTKLSESHLKRIGVSFTLNPLIAEWFATKSLQTLVASPVREKLPEGKIRPVVVRYEVSKGDVFFATDSRSEAEVMIENERALKIVDYKFCFPSKSIADFKEQLMLGGAKRTSYSLGMIPLGLRVISEFCKLRLEDPSLLNARSKAQPHTPYPSRHNITSLLHPATFGKEWLDDLKLHRKFVGGSYQNVYDESLWDEVHLDDGE